MITSVRPMKRHHLVLPRAHTVNVQNCFQEASMNNAPQPQPTLPDDPDMALLFLGSWFEKLRHAPERNDTTLDAVAGHIILDERPKTLLGLVITALAEKVASPSSVDARVRQPPALRSGRSRGDRRGPSLMPACPGV
jgi:hypothetical protein